MIRFFKYTQTGGQIVEELFMGQFEGSDEEFRTYCKEHYNALDCGSISDNEYDDKYRDCYSIINGNVVMDLEKLKKKILDEFSKKREKELDYFEIIDDILDGKDLTKHKQKKAQLDAIEERIKNGKKIDDFLF